MERWLKEESSITERLIAACDDEAICKYSRYQGATRLRARLERHYQNYKHHESQILFYPCVFQFAGCDHSAHSEEEWKHHVTHDHIPGLYWVCEHPTCQAAVDDISGKVTCNVSPTDYRPRPLPKEKSRVFASPALYVQHLYTEHCVRGCSSCQHLPQKPPPYANSSIRGWVLNKVDAAMRADVGLPEHLQCPANGCTASFHGSTGWTQRMDHVANHLKLRYRDSVEFDETSDRELIEWASRPDVAIIGRTPGALRNWTLTKLISNVSKDTGMIGSWAFSKDVKQHTDSGYGSLEDHTDHTQNSQFAGSVITQRETEDPGAIDCKSEIVGTCSPTDESSDSRALSQSCNQPDPFKYTRDMRVINGVDLDCLMDADLSSLLKEICSSTARQHAGQTSQSETGSGPGNGNVNTSHPKRVRSLAPGDAEDGQCDRSRGRKRKRKDPQGDGGATDRESSMAGRFACPFFKQNPAIYGEWGSCTRGYRELARVK